MEFSQKEIERLIQAEINLDAILDSFHGDMVITDGTGVVLVTSASCEQLYGIRRTEFMGRNVEELEQKGVLNPSVTKRVLREQTRVSMIQHTKTGAKVLVTAVPVFNEKRQIIRVVSYTHNLDEVTELQHLIGKLQQEMTRMRGELQLLRNKELGDGVTIVIGHSLAYLMETIARVAKVDVNILLLGESGVGKSLYARYIHQISKRSQGPFIELNCGAIPEALFESELFGYEPGAFTGANKAGKLGLFELAHNGTIFLDEIGEMPLSAQVKLLKVIQEQEFLRVGGSKKVKSNFRLIAATNRNLDSLVKDKKFREDLYFRLNVVPLTIPPLRDRQEDIQRFADYNLERLNAKYGLHKSVAPAVYERLKAYHWPGNIRELEHLLERLIVTVEGPTIYEFHLPIEFLDAAHTAKPIFTNKGTLPNMLAELEKKILSEARLAGKSTNVMAREFGISQPTIVRKLQKYGII